MAGRLLAFVLFSLALLGGGYWWGETAANNARDADLLQVTRDASDRYQEQVKLGNKAATSLIADKQDLQTRNQELERKFHAARAHAPLVAAAPPAREAAQGNPPPGQDCVVLLPTPELSRRAVWMWNSALAATDVPSGACGADDTSAEACAVTAGIGLEAAWENHAANAKSCAEDRLQHQRLIDFIKSREVQP